MMTRKIIEQDDGLVGIVVTVLIIGLIVVVTGIIQSVYVPQWLEQKEADHMHLVSYQFTQLKQSLDILSIIDQKNSISNYITLGTSEIPIFGTGRTYDYLSVLSNYNSNCSMQISNDTNSYYFSLGTIKFSSGNSYFVDQDFIYEAGAVVLSQSGGNILNGRPSFLVSNITNISFNIANISNIRGKENAGGYGTYSLYMEYNNSASYSIKNLTYINITTNYGNAWYTFFNDSSVKNSLDLDESYGVYKNGINQTAWGISVKFENISRVSNIMLKVSDITVQIAPGWVK